MDKFLFDQGDRVRTPSGRLAEVIGVVHGRVKLIYIDEVGVELKPELLTIVSRAAAAKEAA